jgi:hypothetical protein
MRTFHELLGTGESDHHAPLIQNGLADDVLLLTQKC